MTPFITIPTAEEIQKRITEMTERLSSREESKERALFRAYLDFVRKMRLKKHSYASITTVLSEVAELKVSPATLKKWLSEEESVAIAAAQEENSKRESSSVRAALSSGGALLNK